MQEMFDKKTNPRANRPFQSFAMASIVLLSLNLSSLEAQESEANDALINLKTFDELQHAFQSDSGNVRLVTLLSPT
jgi:hypothetical protein